MHHGIFGCITRMMVVWEISKILNLFFSILHFSPINRFVTQTLAPKQALYFRSIHIPLKVRVSLGEACHRFKAVHMRALEGARMFKWQPWAKTPLYVLSWNQSRDDESSLLLWGAQVCRFSCCLTYTRWNHRCLGITLYIYLYIYNGTELLSYTARKSLGV